MDNRSPLAYVISTENILKKHLVAELSQKGCGVTYKLDPSQVPQYLFLIQGIDHDFLSDADLDKVFDFVQLYNTKTQIILPYVVSSSEREKVENIVGKAKKLNNANLTIVYVGEIFGVAMNLKAHGTFAKLVGGLKPVFDFDIYVIDAKNCVGTLLKGIFSYGFEKKELVVATKISAFDFVEKIKKLTDISFSEDPSIKPTLTVSNFDLANVPFSEGELKKTVEWAPRMEVKNEVRLPELPKFRAPKLKVPAMRIPRMKLSKIRLGRKYFVSFVVVLWIFSLPFLSFFVSSIFLKLGFNSARNFDFTKAKIYLTIAKESASFSQTTFLFFRDGKGMSKLLFDYSTVANESAELLSLGQAVAREVSASETYDLAQQSNDLYLGMDDLYKKISYLIADKNEYKSFVFLPVDFDLKAVADFLNKGKEIAKALPTLLGTDKEKSYLVLLQDGSEIRPTGGKITSFGIFSFDNGHLSSKNFYDVSSVDGLLKGQISPPVTLSRYLGVSNWKFSDSNWDSDFKASAYRAQWFLKNELQENTDGVIAFNSEVFNRLQGIENNIFEWVNTVFNGLKNGDILMFVNDENTLSYLRQLHWDGGYTAMPPSGCSVLSNCAYLPMGVVEANLGGNKIDHEISRSTRLAIDLKGQVVKNSLTVNFVNSSNQVYKDYIRVLVPKNSTLIGTNLDITTVDDRTEAGMFIQIPAGGRKEVVFNWSYKNVLDFSKAGKIYLYLRKQPGVFNPTSIDLLYPASLTGRVVSSYNTTLVADFVKEINF